MANAKDPDDLDVAVVHGNYLGRGGGERVADAIARTFDAPLYYGFGEPNLVPDDIDSRSLFNDRPLAAIVRNHQFLRDLYYLRAFPSVPALHDYDIVIQSGNEPGWYVPPTEQVVVRYTHSTPVKAYDHYPYTAPERGFLFEVYTFLTRQLYQPTIAFPDIYVANSEVTARRLDRYWDKHNAVAVVYPPVDIEAFGPQHATDSPVSDDYYLVLDRLEPTKNVEAVVETFLERDERLVVAGTGSEEATLQELAADAEHVSVRGYVDEDEKRALLAGAKALCYAAEREEFGIVPIEAMASGTAVIGPREGFTKHQIVDGRNGILYDRSPEAISMAIDRFQEDGITMDSDDLRQFAAQFSEETFRDGMHTAVLDAVERAAIEGPAEGL